MMRFDQNKDGKLTKAEVTDQRVHRLFDRADADRDGTVTKAELTALATEWQEREGNRPPGFGPPGGFPPPGGGPRGMMGPPPRPGEILPAPLRRNLKLSAEQARQLDELQKEVDAKIEKILNDDQKQQLKAMRQRGPGMFGGPVGRPPDFGRLGRPGGPPDGPGRGGPPDGPPDGQKPPPPPDDQS
jgi:hypothetical protein